MQQPLFTLTPGIKPLSAWGGLRDLLSLYRFTLHIWMDSLTTCRLLNRWTETRMLFAMPRKNHTPNNAWSPPEFISARLSRDEKNQFREWLPTVTMDVEAIMLEYLSASTKVTFSWDEKNDTYICTFVPKGDDHINAGKCLSSRGPDAWTAFLVNVFKDDQLFGRSVWDHLSGDDDIS